MRVQRAPSAADQPQRPPTGIGVARPRVATTGAQAPRTDVVASAAAPGFSADVDLDLTGLLRRLEDESQVAAEVIVRLVAACRHERLIDDESALRVVKLTAEGLVGVQFGHAVNQSAYGISSGLESLSPKLPATTPRTLTVVLLTGSRVHTVGDWGWGGVGVVTLGPIVPTVVSSQKHGLSIMQRCVSHLGFTVQNSSTAAYGVVRALDTVARSVEERDR